MKFTLALLVGIASAAPTELLKRADATCGSVHYSSDAVNQAAQASCKLVKDHDTAGSSSYPHQYKNYEGFEFKGLNGPFYEFPILKSGSVYNGGTSWSSLPCFLRASTLTWLACFLLLLV